MPTPTSPNDLAAAARATLAGSALAALVIGLDGRVLAAGDGAAEVLGDDLVGRHAGELPWPDRTRQGHRLAEPEQPWRCWERRQQGVVTVLGRGDRWWSVTGRCLWGSLPEAWAVLALLMPADPAGGPPSPWREPDQLLAWCHLDPSGRILHVSTAASSVLGSVPDALVGTNSLESCHPDDLPHVLADHLALALGDRMTEASARVRHRDGGWVPVAYAASRVDGPDGWTAQLAIRDLTRAVNALAALESYRALTEDASDVITRGDASGIRYASAAARRVLGLAPEALLGDDALALVHPTDVDAVRRFYDELMQEGAESSIEYRIRTADGEWRWVESRGRGVRGPDGRTEVAMVSRDVSRRKATEDALAQSEARYKLLAEHASDVIATIHPSGRLHYLSPSARTVLGWDPLELLGTDGGELVHPHDAEALAELRASPRDLTRPTVLRVRHALGHWVWVEVNWTLSREGLVHLVARDITARRLAEAELAGDRALLRHERDLMGAVLDTAPVLIAVLDGEGRVVQANTALERSLGLPSAALLGRSCTEWVPGAAGHVLREVLARVLRDGEGEELETPLRTRSGGLRQVVWSIAALRPDSAHLVVVGDDVTERRRADRAATEARTRFEAAFEHAPVAMLLATLAGGVFLVNDAAVELFGRPVDELCSLGLGDLTVDDDWPDAAAMLDDLQAGRLESAERELRLRGPDGRTLSTRAALVLIRDEEGGPSYLLVQIVDLTALTAVQRELLHRTLHDDLTGLANRSLLGDRVAHAAARLQRRDSVAALLFVDLDRFKRVNDEHGHTVGDAVLVEVARRLRTAVRPADTVARLGGDEFVVLAEDLAGAEQAQDLAARVEEAVGERYHLDTATLILSASVGVALLEPGDGRGLDALLTRADLDMYRHKRTRRR